MNENVPFMAWLGSHGFQCGAGVGLYGHEVWTEREGHPIKKVGTMVPGRAGRWDCRDARGEWITSALSLDAGLRAFEDEMDEAYDVEHEMIESQEGPL